MPEQKPETMGPPSSAEGLSFNLLDFTSSLLNFSGPPVPQKKPAYIPPPPSRIEKLLTKYEKETASGIMSPRKQSFIGWPSRRRMQAI